METKTILITGANKGLGFEIARQLLKRGFQIFISGRDQNRLTEALNQLKKESSSVEKILIDVSDPGSVREAAKILEERKIQLDVIINNAGIEIKGDHFLAGQEEEILIKTMNTNSYGPLRVVHSFLSLMKSPGRIINISSSGGSMSEPVGGWSPAYCVSKTTLNAITRHLSYELKSKGIAVNAVCPGWVQTDMGGSSAPRSVEKGAETPVWLASEASQNLTGKIFRDKKEISW